MFPIIEGLDRPQFDNLDSDYSLDDLVNEFLLHNRFSYGEKSARDKLSRMMEEEGLSVGDLRSEFGFYTQLSPKGSTVSRRSELYRLNMEDNSSISNDVSDNEELMSEVLGLYKEAFDLFSSFFPYKKEINGFKFDIELKAVGGSFVNGNPSIGIHRPGLTFQETHELQIIKGAARRFGGQSPRESLPSDIDSIIHFSSDIEPTMKNGKKFNEAVRVLKDEVKQLSKAVFDEYGIFIHAEFSSLKEAILLEQFNERGGVFGFQNRE